MSLAPGWRPWVLVPLVAGLVAFLAALLVPLAAVAGAVLSLAAAGIAWFFRDPDRSIGTGIVAAADGRVREAEEDRIVTFLNLHDVHVVRAPYAGRVTELRRLDGPRRPAFLDSARDNAGLELTLDTDTGERTLRLVAGLVARQAVAWVDEGDAVAKGDRVGMIRFGSRVDVELPPEASPTVEVGQKARAGETTIATLEGNR